MLVNTKYIYKINANAIDGITLVCLCDIVFGKKNRLNKYNLMVILDLLHTFWYKRMQSDM